MCEVHYDDQEVVSERAEDFKFEDGTLNPYCTSEGLSVEISGEPKVEKHKYEQSANIKERSKKAKRGNNEPTILKEFTTKKPKTDQTPFIPHTNYL